MREKKTGRSGKEGEAKIALNDCGAEVLYLLAELNFRLQILARNICCFYTWPL